MTPLVVAALAALPCVYWTPGVDSRATLEAAGIKRICVAPELADAWRAAGFTVMPISAAEFEAREPLPPPGITARAGVASPTRSPWVVANGWRMTRTPSAKFKYDVPAGKGVLAAAEAFAYGGDVVLKVDPADLPAVGKLLAYLEGLPDAPGDTVADLGVVDDGSDVTGEVMNLLTRRNLPFAPVKAPAAQYRINIAIGTADYPKSDAADPSAFALKIRRQVTDDQRTLRVFGSEVVICRLTRGAGGARLHVLNYGGREIEGLRIRVRGEYSSSERLDDYAMAGGFTEFSIPRLATYAVIDLR
jgi:hypothetical protein